MMDRNLIDILNLSCDQPGDSNFDFLGSSPFYDDNYFIEHLTLNPNDFVVLGMNSQSLRAKHDDILLMLNNYNHPNSSGIAVICLQETWISTNVESYIEIPNYNCVLKPCSASSHGGLATYIRADLNYNIVTVSNDSTNIWEQLFVQVYGAATGNSKIVIGNIYRPPRNQVDLIDTFLVEFNNMLESLESYNSVYVTGDFNLDLFKCQTDIRTNRFLHQTFATGFFPKLLHPTRITEISHTLIDNVFCKFSTNFHSIKSGILTHRMSDHQPYFISVNMPRTPRLSFEHPRYQYKTMMSSESKLKFQEILNTELTLDNFDTSNDAEPQKNFNTLHEIMTAAHSACFTKKRVRCDRRKVAKLPWVTPGIIKSIRTRNKLYKKLKNLGDCPEKYKVLKLQLKNFGKVLNKTIKISKRNYYSKVFEKQKGDPRRMWDTITSLTNGKNRSRSLPESFIIDGETVSDLQVIADGFNSYFLNVANKITEQLDQSDSTSFKSYLNESIHSRFNFSPVNEDEVLKYLNALPSKCTLDCYGFNTELIKQCRTQLTPALTLIINQCITHGLFPETLKIARVSVIYKKAENNIFENYRPISILPVLSKIFERVLHNQLSLYFMNNHLFYVNQYGFRSNHSTQLAALQFVDAIMNNLDNRKPYISLFTDLSKAFDCLDHSILLTKLKYYGVEQTSLRLLNNYLTNRYQYVEIKLTTNQMNQYRNNVDQTCHTEMNTDTIKSNLGLLSKGVPQGSILGPLLFIIYINDFSKCSSFFSSILYADDSTFSASVDTNNSNMNMEINNEMRNVHNWLKSNSLCLNVNKTKYMVFNRKSRPNIDQLDLNIEIDNVKLEQVKSFNFLGLTINDQLDWSLHTNNICKKLSRNIGILRRLKTQLPFEILKMLYFSLIHSHLSYMILVWGHDHAELLLKQKQALRVIHSKHYLCHTDPLFKSAKIIKVNDLHTQSLLKFCRKYVNADLPSYFMSMDFKRNCDNHRYNTIHKNSFISAKPGSEKARNLLRYKIPALLNELPANFNEALHSKSDYAITRAFKYSTLNSYSDVMRCPPGSGCWPCSIATKVE